MVVTAWATRALPSMHRDGGVGTAVEDLDQPGRGRGWPLVVVARADGAAVGPDLLVLEAAADRGCRRGKEPWSISRPLSAPSSPVDTDSVETNGNAVGIVRPRGWAEPGAAPSASAAAGGWGPPPQSPSALFCDGGFTPPLVAVAESPW